MSAAAPPPYAPDGRSGPPPAGHVPGHVQEESTEVYSETTPPRADERARNKRIRRLDRVIIRFAGDSGDGMQLTGDRFTSETAS
ncbi:2-oxoacid:acceptor oxidoreductase subunit alpha, partial [Streptomyces sp. NPDC054844]